MEPKQENYFSQPLGKDHGDPQKEKKAKWYLVKVTPGVGFPFGDYFPGEDEQEAIMRFVRQYPVADEDRKNITAEEKSDGEMKALRAFAAKDHDNGN
jgi:hypothetical protein